jgi:uncharacterized protein YbjT (DUF2867 family)
MAKVFVVGATGETGRRIVRELVDRQVEVRAMVRNLESARTLLPAAVELVVGDVLDLDSIKRGMAGCTAVICATGARPSLNIAGPFLVDYQGTKNLIDTAKATGIQRFVLVSSLCVSQFFHPLNLFWLVLFWKKQAETYLQDSGLTYTIVRPGGLKNEDNRDSIVMASADTLFEGSIPRQKVAQVCVESLEQPAARDKIVEIIAKPDVSALDWPELFAQVSAG